jgi:hypothetical protein
MKAINTLLILLLVNNAFGQREVIDSRLKEYNIPGDYIVNALKDSDAEHYLSFKSVTWLPSKQGMQEIIEEGEFHPDSPVGEKWKLLKLNGMQPGIKDAREFSKVHNTIKNNVNAIIDDESYRIVDDNENELIISLKYRKESLPKRYKFLGKCTGMAYIDKKLKKLTTVEYKNDNPVKIWRYKATGMTLVQYYTYDESENKYFITKEEMDIDSNYLGKSNTILFDIDYSDYKKVK